MRDTSKRSNKHLRAQAILAFILGVLALVSGELAAARWGGARSVTLLTRPLAPALLVYGVLCLLLSKGRLPRLARVLRAVWLCVAGVLLVSFPVIEILIFLGDKSDFDVQEGVPGVYMIILGAGLNGATPSLTLSSRLDAALPCLMDNPDLICVLSGGQGPDEDIPEALAMYRYLTARGVPEAQLLIEDRAVNTAQNIVYSLDMLNAYARAHGTGAVERVVVCSSGYHLFRARRLLRRGGVTPYALAAPPPVRHLNAAGYLREYFSVLFMWRRG